jgi:glycosyltransferase involved in cell wall biosynthesis
MTKDQPLVSIITPTYNHEAFIEECIISVQSQSYKNWEMVIIDDGSTDHTVAKIQSFIEKDPQIILIQQENKGIARLSETYNTALSHCSGKWIAVLEGDDYWLPEKLSLQVANCSDQVIICYGSYVDKIGESIKKGLLPPFISSISMKQFIPILLMHQSYLIAVTALFRKKSLLSIGGFHQDGSPAAVDMATLMRLIDLPGLVNYIPENLGVWRHHSQQSTHLFGVELTKFNARLVYDYLGQLSDHACKDIGISRSAVIQARNAEIASACFVAIRQKLRNKSRSDVLPLIKDMWSLGNGKRKIEAVFAFVAYYLHMNIEIPLQVLDWLRSNQKYATIE